MLESFQGGSRGAPKLSVATITAKYDMLMFIVYVGSHNTSSSSLLSGLCLSDVKYCQILAFKDIYNVTILEELFQILWVVRTEVNSRDSANYQESSF